MRTDDPEFARAPASERALSTPSVDDRVEALLGQMTLDEKLGQLACVWANGAASEDEQVAMAAGGVAWPVSATESSPRVGAARVNALQRRLVEETRLGIPALFNEEALCGLKVPGATVFPDAIAQAATWDPEVVEAMARTIGTHGALLGMRHVLSPLCDVARDPRWGRIEETYGEDPYLVGSLACAFVRGVQEADPERPGMATLKHFVAFSGSEGGRNLHGTHVGLRELREIYGLPFEMAIRAANARAVMCSYQQVDGVPVQASRVLLTDLLRDEYGFDGVLISDLNSVGRLHLLHGVSETATDSIATSLKAGLDVELGEPITVTGLAEAVDDGRLDVADVERAVTRVLRMKVALGLFEDPYADEEQVPEVLDGPSDRAMARRVAERALVLLRNEPVDDAPLLPIADTTGSIAVIGPNADRPFALMGNYSFPVLGSAAKRMADADAMDPNQHDTSRLAARPPADDAVPRVDMLPVVTVLEGIRARTPAGVDVRFAPGCPVETPDATGIDEAVELARASDLAVVVVGDQAGIFVAATVGENVDSAGCALPGLQRQLVESVVATGTPTVVVLTHGRPFVLDWMASTVPAILSAWFPGEEGGHAVAAALFGDVNPGGKSPVSFLSHAGVLPAPYNRTVSGGAYFDAAVSDVFAFGHGLSYTTFAYDELVIDPSEVDSRGVVRISCVVSNTGSWAGDEVVQLYVHDPVARTSRPRIELKGFQRVSLEPGASVRVAFEMATDRLALYDPADGWVVEPGRIDVRIGSSSQDIRLDGTLQVTGPVRRVGADRELFTYVEVIPVA